jgi:hypothetical protein
MKNYKWINYVAFVLFAAGFALANEWFTLEFAPAPYPVYVMLGATVVSFFFGTALRWLGIAIVAFAFALLQGWIQLNMGNVSFSPTWLILTGYLMVFFSAE